VGEQLSALARVRVQVEWQVIGVESARAVEYKNPKREIGDDAVKLFGPRFFKLLGQVHSSTIS
jgi:hypothetical protein